MNAFTAVHVTKEVKWKKKKDNAKSTSQSILSFKDESDALAFELNTQIVINSFLIVLLY